MCRTAFLIACMTTAIDVRLYGIDCKFRLVCARLGLGVLPMGFQAVELLLST